MTDIRGSIRAFGGCARLRWKTHDEFAAEIRPLARHGDGAAVHLDEMPHQREADAQPASFPLERAVRLHEHVEDRRQQSGFDADAGILDAKGHRVALALRSERDAAAAGVYFAALFRRLEMTCAMRVASTSSTTGSCGSSSVNS